jgi:hypothetical protein
LYCCIVRLPINYLKTGKILRGLLKSGAKINNSFEI